MIDRYVTKNGEKLRCGFTTGTCAAAAAKASVDMLIFNRENRFVTILTPMGWPVKTEIRGLKSIGNYVECYVIKDAGDDPDCTNGIRIYARAKKIKGHETIITGGEGIGRVTRKGLAVGTGLPAINPVPMKMIVDEVEKVKPADTGISVEISAPEGVELSRRTFNPKLGIVGGISILGTTGIVEPMSKDSIRESLALKLSVMKEEGNEIIVFVPGNYGKNFAINELAIPEDNIARTANYLGYMIKSAEKDNIGSILLVGHIGKLIKLAGGIFNTHSSVSSAGLEILAANYGDFTGDITGVKKIMGSNTTEEAVEYISNDEFFKYLSDKISHKYMDLVHGGVNVETVIFSLRRGLLAKSENSDAFIKMLRANNE